MGIGSRLASPWAKGLPLTYLLAGTILPDFFDKTLYYALSFATGLHGAELGLISGTRTVGHTGIFLILLMILAFARKSKPWAALALGVATHLLLDNITDRAMGHPGGTSSALIALSFPLMGFHFAVIPFTSLVEHLRSFNEPFLWVSEIIGVGLLAWDTWKRRHTSEIVRNLRQAWHGIRKRKVRRRQHDGFEV